jgi:hypothetical protein
MYLYARALGRWQEPTLIHQQIMFANAFAAYRQGQSIRSRPPASHLPYPFILQDIAQVQFFSS